MSEPYEIGNIDNSPVGQETPREGAFTDLEASSNPSTDGGVGNRAYNDARYALVSGAAAGKVHFDVVENNVSAISKGQACARAAGDGTHFDVGLCDCDDATKINMIGLASTDMVQDGAGIVVNLGILESVDTRTSNTAVNPNAETWVVNDCLYVSSTPGGLTNVRPTTGRIIRAATTMKGNSETDTLLVFSHVNPINLGAASGEDVIIHLGDNGGTNKISFCDYANNEIASIDSDGNITTPKPIYSTYWTSRAPFLDENNANDNGVPTQVLRGLFRGYSFPIWSTPANQNEELNFRMRVPHRWDGTTNPWFVAISSIVAVEDIGDKYRFQLEWQAEDVDNVIPSSIQETLTSEVTLIDGSAYYATIITFELDATTLIAGQNMQLRLRRIAATSLEITAEPAIWHWDSRWKMNRLGSETIQGYPA